MRSNTDPAAPTSWIERLSRRFGLTEVQAERWAAIRGRGRRRYIFLIGVLRWGLGTAVLSTVLSGWFGASGSFLERLAIALVVYPLTGIGYGAWMWSFNERRYRDWIEKHGEQFVSPPQSF